MSWVRVGVMEPEIGFVCLFPITIGDMVFDESVTLADGDFNDGVPPGWQPSLRQVAEWSRIVRADRNEMMGGARSRNSSDEA